MKVALAVLLVTLALAEAGPGSSSSFAAFMAKHGKKYSVAEQANRAKVWAAAKAKIDAHNALHAKGQVSYTMEDNPLSDLTDAEFNKLKGAVPGAAPRNAIPFESLLLERQALPTALNLTNTTCMPAIKNQANCGSCWAFSAVNPIEYQYCKKTAKKVLFSEQQLVSCSGSAYSNYGCNGGFYDRAWNYINKTGGITNSTVYSYTSGSTGVAGNCTFKNTTAVAKVKGWITVYNNETAMRQALVTYGPLSVAVYVNTNFQYYSTGVYKDTTCYNNGTVNHAVNVVGYGTDATAGPYWIVRNSWATTWGLRGYMHMARGVNTCGIAKWAMVPVLL